MLNIPKNTIIPKNQKERKEVNTIYGEQQKRFREKMTNSCTAEELPIIPAKVSDIYPISQKVSKQSEMSYGEIGTIGGAGCGPLAFEYALRVLDFSVEFEEIVHECVEKGYRAYIFDEENNIIDGCGTENCIFDVVAQELSGELNELISALAEGPITLLVNNTIYHNDEKRRGNHFITMIGLNENGEAILMDGNLIVNDPSEALVMKDFRKLIPGIQTAWSWNKTKVKTYLK